MTPRYFVWRPTSTGWRADNLDPDGRPLPELSEEAALARVEALKAAYLRCRRRPMYPPPVITLGEPPRMSARKRTQLARVDVPVNGGARRAVAVPEEVQR
jgi:hypothetical protein